MTKMKYWFRNGGQIQVLIGLISFIIGSSFSIGKYYAKINSTTSIIEKLENFRETTQTDITEIKTQLKNIDKRLERIENLIYTR